MLRGHILGVKRLTSGTKDGEAVFDLVPVALLIRAQAGGHGSRSNGKQTDEGRSNGKAQPPVVSSRHFDLRHRAKPERRQAS
jgi:hypothetical protein